MTISVDVCPVASASWPFTPKKPHMWSLLDKHEWAPPNAPAASVTIFAFFCQWCMVTTHRTWEELEVAEGRRNDAQ
jgi:hypothetical protein